MGQAFVLKGFIQQGNLSSFASHPRATHARVLNIYLRIYSSTEIGQAHYLKAE